MALTFKLEAAQMEQIAGLTTAINNLSENLAKWQSKQSEAVEQGFNDLVLVLSGTNPDDPVIQEQVNRIRASREAIQGAIDRNKGDENG